MDETARRAAKPDGIAEAEFILGVMERFNYPSIAATRRESAELFRLLEAEWWGRGKDLEEEQSERETEISRLQNGGGT